MQKKPPKAKISSSPPTMQSPSLLERIKNLSSHQQPKLAQTTSFTSDRVKGRVRSNFSEYFDARKIQFNHTLDNLRSSSSKRKHFYDEKPEPDDAIWTLRVENETQKKQLALLTDLNQKLQKNLAQLSKEDQSADNQNLNKLLQGYQKKAEERKSIMKQLYGILKTKDQELEYLRSAHEKQVKQLDSKMTQLQQLFDHQMIQNEDRIYKLEFKVRDLKGYRQNKLAELTTKEDKMKEILFRLVKKSESNEKINEVKGILAFIQKEKQKLQPEVIPNDYQKLADIHESYINHIEALNQELAQFINQQELNPIDIYNKNLSEKLNNQVAQLSQNITYLTQQLQSAEQKSTLQESEIDVLEIKIHSLEDQLQQINNQNNTLIQERQQLIDKIQLLHQDSIKSDKLVELQNQIKQLEKSNSQFKINNDIMKSEIQQQSQSHIQELNTLNQTIRQQIHDFQNQKIQLNKYQQEVQQVKSQDQIIIQDLNDQIQTLKENNTKLKQELATTDVFNKNLSERLNNQITSSTQSINHLTQQLQSVESKSIELENELEIQENSNHQLQDQIQELQATNNTLLQERQSYIDKIQLLKKTSIDSGQAQSGKISLTNKLYEVQDSNIQLKNQNERLQEQLNQQSQESTALNESSRQYFNELEQLKLQLKNQSGQAQSDILSLTNKLQEVEELNIQLKNQNEHLKEQLNQQSQTHLLESTALNESNRQQSNELEQLKLQLNRQQQESQHTKKQDQILIQELTNQIHLLSDTKNAMKQQLFNLQNQLLESQNQQSRFYEELYDSQQIRQKIAQQLVSSEDQCKQLKILNDAQSKVSEELKMQITHFEQTRQSNANQIQQELDQLKKQYHQQQTELSQALKSYSDSEEQILSSKAIEKTLEQKNILDSQTIDQLVNQIKSQEEKIILLNTDLKSEQDKLLQFENLINQNKLTHKQVIETLEQQKNQLQVEYESQISNLQQELSLQTQDLQLQLSFLLNEKHNLKGDYEKLNKQFEDLNEDYQIGLRDINQYKLTIDKFKFEIDNLNSQLSDAQTAQSSLFEQNTSLQQQQKLHKELIDTQQLEIKRLSNECDSKYQQILHLENDQKKLSQFQSDTEEYKQQIKDLLEQQGLHQNTISDQISQISLLQDQLKQCYSELIEQKKSTQDHQQQIQFYMTTLTEKDKILEEMKNDSINQKQQIDQLTDQLRDQQSDYELRQKIQQQQLNTIKQSNTIYVQELENIKEDYDICQRNINQLQSQIKQLNEDKLKIISEQIVDYQQQLDVSKRNNLQQEVKLSDLTIDNQKLQIQIQSLHNEKSSMQKQLEEQMTNLESQLVSTKNELSILTKTLNDQIQEAHNIEVKLNETNDANQREIVQLNSQIADLKNKLEHSEVEYKKQISDQQKSYEVQLKEEQAKLAANYELSELLSQQDDQIKRLTHEHNSLIIGQQELNLKNKELEQINQKHLSQIDIYTKEISELKEITEQSRSQIVLISNQETKNKIALEVQNTENQSLKESINKYITELKNQQQAFELLTQERDKESQRKNQEIEFLVQKTKNLEEQNELFTIQVKETQSKIEQLSSQNNDLNKESSILQQDKQQLQQQYDQAQATIQDLKTQVNELHDQKETLQKQLDISQSDSNSLKEQLEKISIQNTEKIHEQIARIAQLESNLKDQQALMNENNTKSQEQIKYLEDQLDERQQDYDLEKTILQKQINQYQQESSKVYNDYLDIHDQFEMEKRNTKVLQSKLQNCENQIENQTQFIEQLKMAQEFLFAENNQQFNDQIQKYQNKIQQLQDQQAEQAQQHTQLQEENMKQSEKLVKLQKKIDSSSIDLLTEQNKVQKLTQEKEMITSMLIKNEVEINQAHQQLKAKDDEIKRLNQELANKQEFEKGLKASQIVVQNLELEVAANSEEIKKQKKMYSELSDEYELLQQRNLQGLEQQSAQAQQLQEQEQLIKQLEEQLKEKQSQLKDQMEICYKRQEEIQTLEQQIELQSSDYNTIQQQFDEEKQQVEQLQNTILEKEEDIQKMRDLVERLEINQNMKNEVVSQRLSVPQLVVSRVDKSFMKDSIQMSNNPMDEDEPMNRSFVGNPLEDDVSGNPIIAVVSQNLSQHFNIGSSVKEDQQQIINNLQEQITQLFEENNRLRLNELQMVGSQKHRVLILEEQLQKMRDQIMQSDFVSDSPEKEPANAQELIHQLKEKVSSLELDIQLASFENDELKQEVIRMKHDIDRSGLQVATLNKSIKLLQEANASLHHHKNGVIQSPPSQPKDKIKGDHIVNVVQKVLQNDEDWKLYLQFTGLEGKVLQDFKDLLVQIKPQEDVNLLRKQLEREVQQRESIARDLRQTLQDKQNLSQQFIEFKNQISSQRVSEQGSALKDPSEIDEEDNLRQLISKLKRETEQTRKENLQLRQQLKSQDDDEDKYSHQQRLLKDEIKSQRTQLEQLIMDNKKLVDLLSNSEDAAMAGHLSSLLAKFFEAYVKENKQDLIVYYKSLVSMLGTAQREEFINKLCASLDKKKTSGVFGKIFQ